MTIASEEILDQFDRLRDPEKFEVAAAILKRLTAAFNQPNSASFQEWKQVVFRLAGSWGEEFPSLDQIREDRGQDLPREMM